MAELGAKGSLAVRTVPLVPRHDLRVLRGTYMELTARSTWAGTAIEDYLHITLTDEDDIPDAMGKLRTVYPNLMTLSYDNRRTRAGAVLPGAPEADRRSPLALFAAFYEMQNGRPLSPEQESFTAELIESIWEEKS